MSRIDSYVALGDSFTEGVGDADPTSANGVKGWADRVAEQLGATNPEFRYANLAVRGKLVDQGIVTFRALLDYLTKSSDVST